MSNQLQDHCRIPTLDISLLPDEVPLVPFQRRTLQYYWHSWAQPARPPGHIAEIAQQLVLEWAAEITRLHSQAPIAPPAPVANLELVRVLDIPLPLSLRAWAQEVERSRWMLNLLPGWDGEGAPEYGLETWERAVRLLLRSAILASRICQRTPTPPRIENGPDGSIDLFWESPALEFLVNVPADAVARVQYYGNKVGGGNEVRGSFPMENGAVNLAHLIAWLTA